MLKEFANFAVVLGCLIIAVARSETSCRIPDAPENGSVQVPDETKIGTLIYYSCDVDATLVGESLSTCLPSGEWSFEAPKCLRSCYVSEIEDGQLGKYEWKNQFMRRDFISLQMGKSIKHHEKAILLCDDEYIAGNQEIGRSQEVECNDGSWTKPLHCRPKVSCEMPDVPKHGSVQLSDKLKVGTLAFFSCDEGATLVGVSTTKCLPTEKWSFHPPTCLVSCRNNPPAFENAEIVSINGKHGGNAIYRCAEDSEKLKNETLVCDSGIWKGDPPLCKKKSEKCELFPSLPNLNVHYTHGVRVGSLALFKCMNNASLVGSSAARCIPGGKWSQSLPTCSAVSEKCELFPSSPNLNVHYTRGVRVGSVALFKCLNNASLVGSVAARCIIGGKWSHSSPTCGTENCTVPILQFGDIKKENGDYYWSWSKFRYLKPYAKISNGTVVANGTSVTLFCHRYYAFQETSIKDQRITCSNGLWKPDPVCLPQKCIASGVQNGVLGKYERKTFSSQFFRMPLNSKIQENETLYLRCDNKYAVSGSDKRVEKVSCKLGEWSRKLQCEPASCNTSPPGVENARITVINKSNRGKVIYECDKNFEKIENETVVCVYGAWKGKPPVCKRENCFVPILQHGHMKELKFGEYIWNWKSFRYDRQVYYAKISAGTVVPNNTSLTLFCPRQYHFQGTNYTVNGITCTMGVWKPAPVCIRDV